MNAKDEELTASLMVASRLTKALQTRTREHAPLHSELDVLHAAGELQEGVLPDFVESSCTDYNALIHTHAGSYGNRLNDLLSDTQSRGEFVGSYRIRVVKDGFSLVIDKVRSNEKRGDRYSTLKRRKDDIIKRCCSSFEFSTCHPLVLFPNFLLLFFRLPRFVTSSHISQFSLRTQLIDVLKLCEVILTSVGVSLVGSPS